METIPISEAKTHLTELADRADREHDHFTLTRNGRSRAMLIGMSEWESLQETLAVLSSEVLRKDLAEAAEADAAGNLTDQNEMAALMAERLERG